MGLKNVDVTGNNEVGGLAGYNSGTITNYYATGDVERTDCVGGLVGANYQGTIENCNSTGSVTGASFIGGLAGFNNAKRVT